jgi:hypothetical protein
MAEANRTRAKTARAWSQPISRSEMPTNRRLAKSTR